MNINKTDTSMYVIYFYEYGTCIIVKRSKINIIVYVFKNKSGN